MNEPSDFTKLAYYQEGFQVRLMQKAMKSLREPDREMSKEAAANLGRMLAQGAGRMGGVLQRGLGSFGRAAESMGRGLGSMERTIMSPFQGDGVNRAAAGMRPRPPRLPYSAMEMSRPPTPGRLGVMPNMPVTATDLTQGPFRTYPWSRGWSPGDKTRYTGYGSPGGSLSRLFQQPTTMGGVQKLAMARLIADSVGMEKAAGPMAGLGRALGSTLRLGGRGAGYFGGGLMDIARYGGGGLMDIAKYMGGAAKNFGGGFGRGISGRAPLPSMATAGGAAAAGARTPVINPYVTQLAQSRAAQQAMRQRLDPILAQQAAQRRATEASAAAAARRAGRAAPGENISGAGLPNPEELAAGGEKAVKAEQPAGWFGRFRNNPALMGGALGAAGGIAGTEGLEYMGERARRKRIRDLGFLERLGLAGQVAFSPEGFINSLNL